MAKRVYTTEEFRATAQGLVSYYDHRVRNEPRDDWKAGLKVAELWLSLLDSKPTKEDISELTILLSDPSSSKEASAWIEMRLWVDRWMETLS